MKRKWTKKLLLLTIIFSTITPFSVQAQEAMIIQFVERTDTIQPRVEETCYHYMEIRGVMHKRLWSITYSRWIDTMWYPC